VLRIVDHGDDMNRLGQDKVVDPIGESSNRCPANVPPDNLVELRIVPDAPKGLFHGGEKAGAESRDLLLVPTSSVVEIDFREPCEL
jgi:hypothetical protein